MNRSESITKIAPAIVAMQAALKPAIKDSKNPFFNSKYADLGSVWEACYKALEENKLAVVQMSSPAGPGRIALETIILHESGEWISGIAEAPSSGAGKDGKVKDDPQTYGSAQTYLRRYGLASAVGVIAEDDDGNTATHGAKSPASQTKPAESIKVPAVLTPKVIHEIPVTAVDGVTQATMLDKRVQYCIKAGEKYYTLDMGLAKLAKTAHEAATFVKLSYVEEADKTFTLVNLVPLP